ncbi:CaiB/BaiF CoA transferase family protein [Streptomyces hirsutus]|uniref:CaiB/BaiF CoA transferase family protein n=1 Tax=Streptomyces hirsutus TaxID=35620 RepID=UPI0006E1D9EB|nr:CoA transferase [Streptomyces hirsutus]
MTTRAASADGGALAGLRVLEVGHIISGPFCAHLFADHGAEVIKVEPPAGDDMRRWGGLYKGVGLYWPIIGRGKKSVTLDLRDAEGQAAFRELARTADVVIENFRPGTMERWGLGPEDLHADNPDLVMVRITGYGQTGPLRDRAGFGSIAEAMSGFRHLSGEPDRPPVRVGISIGDALAGTQGFIGALLALLSGHLRTGPRGQVIDVALYEATWMYMESILPEFVKLGKVRGPSGPLLPGIAPSSVYPTSDGRWIVMGANKDTVFSRLAAVMERPEWAAPDGRYATHLLRGEHQLELDAEIARWTRGQTVDELLGVLDKAGVPAGRIYTAPDILGDPHYRARGMVVEVPDPSLDGESVPMPGVVPKLSRTPGTIRRGAPLLGEHNDEILGALRTTSAGRR